MKVYNLKCQFGHTFEGWFRSNEDFVSQSEKGILSCPVCDDNVVSRLPSAAHIQAQKSPSLPITEPFTHAERHRDITSEVNKKLLEVARHIIQNSEDVGDQFAQEVRRIHRKEAEERSIYGTATIEESKDLKEEGIEIVSLPVGALKKKPKSIQ